MKNLILALAAIVLVLCVLFSLRFEIRLDSVEKNQVDICKTLDGTIKGEEEGVITCTTK